MENWRYADSTDVPSVIMDRMRREESSSRIATEAWKKTDSQVSMNYLPQSQCTLSLTVDWLRKAEAEIAAIFFHREVSLFFDIYVRASEESVFGKISRNYATVLTAVFDEESNFIAFCCQVHSHTYTCLKYSLKGLVEQGAENYKRTACRFKAPWKIVEETGFTEEGLLRIRRDHSLVNRYDKSLVVGLWHNHDVSIIVTRTKGLAMLYYITNYATKLDTPMWKRLALAADVFSSDSFANNLG
ncbi:uncharacterized protein G6M90_00g006650 [Metarhizium brunneum]|uniref:Uncharacterized protein n=1 Tax=Metarhizium brunneum TaxID=500148 RepID=A0A7D5URZ9_9HYPO|nr:hypothetical protein G6M90_00g006650 [Metarhizium brunneum]